MLRVSARCVCGELRGPEQREFLGETVDVPLVGGHRLAVRLDQRFDGVVEVLHRLVAEVFAFEDLVATQVDDAPLLVHHLVVLEDVLADLGVLLLDRGLGPLDGLGDHLRLDRFVLLEATHRPLQRSGGEQTHQLVVEAEVEPALAGVALTAGAAAELVVDAARVVAFGSDDVEAARCAHQIAFGFALLVELGEQLVTTGERLVALLHEVLGHLVDRTRQREVVDEHLGAEALLEQLVVGEQLGVAAELDVDAAAGHVGGHGDLLRADRPGRRSRPHGCAAWR